MTGLENFGVFILKRYLSFIFVLIAIIILIIGLRVNVYWSGMVSWGLAFICLMFAAYFTKYISDGNE